VGDYDPRDAVHYKHFTTLKGVMEKEDPNNYEFIVPPRLKELYEKKDYGRYGDNGTMPVCFTTNNDITGGNSGSPVIGAGGELIGLAFDGNWEAMSGDIAFETDYQKTICVDTRYILFIIDKYAGASHIIDEITLVE
ncbi:MAG: S46 family peptidase, partial [Bacteroidales bacterium]